jgi:Holliday junction DNA helicase RuvA
MIGHLKGTLVVKRPPWLTLDVGGVGYEIEAPMSTFYQLPQVGKVLTLVTHLHVREDAQLLFGFATEEERALFRSLLKVSSIGPRIALGILSGMSAAGFYRCIREKDLLGLTRVPGVGKKTAERLIVEMADRLPESELATKTALGNGEGAAAEAEGALLSLGYKPGEITRMLKNLDAAKLTTEELIREALRHAHAG